MYERSMAKVGSLAGCTEEFQIDAGIHQGSALGPLHQFLFIAIVDVLAANIGAGPPNAMLFAENLVITLCGQIQETNENRPVYQVERWSEVLETPGLNIKSTED